MKEPLSLVSEQEFNESVRKWSAETRQKAANNITRNTDTKVRAWKKRESKSLVDSLRSRVHRKDGVADRIGYEFERHGVFFHYGVGRGYIKVGNSLVKGHRIDSNKTLVGMLKKRGDKDKDIARMKHADQIRGHFVRKPVNWIDIELSKGLLILADIAQEYYGDKAMKNVLQQFDKIKIQKPSKHSTILV